MPASGSRLSASDQRVASTAGWAGCPSIASWRHNTRFTLPSRIAARVPAEKTAIAAAVERPIPGRASSRAGAVGTRPSWSRSTVRAAAWRWRARL